MKPFESPQNAHESYEPVSSSGGERPWEDVDSAPIGRSRKKPTPILPLEDIEFIPDADVESLPETKLTSTVRSSEIKSSSPKPSQAPESSEAKSGVRVKNVVTSREEIVADFGPSDRPGVPVAGDRSKPPFVASSLPLSRSEHLQKMRKMKEKEIKDTGAAAA